MSFRYRFATILQLRNRQRDDAATALGQVHEAIRRVEQQTDDLERERTALRDKSQQQRFGSVSVDDLLVQGRYDLQLQAQLQSLGKTRGDLLQEMERRQQALVAAEADVKRFERIEEQDRQTFRRDLLRREQAEADDAIACRYTIDRQRQS